MKWRWLKKSLGITTYHFRIGDTIGGWYVAGATWDSVLLLKGDVDCYVRKEDIWKLV
jgi:hypothetical protein